MNENVTEVAQPENAWEFVKCTSERGLWSLSNRHSKKKKKNVKPTYSCKKSDRFSSYKYKDLDCPVCQKKGFTLAMICEGFIPRDEESGWHRVTGEFYCEHCDNEISYEHTYF